MMDAENERVGRGDWGSNDQVEDNVVDPDMEEMLRHVEPKVLIGSAKGLENYESLKKIARDRVYDESNGCQK